MCAFVFLLTDRMLSTGDVQGGLRKLETLLRAIKYPGHVNFNGYRLNYLRQGQE